MNTSLLERLRSFQIPPATPFSPGHFIVARLQGVDFQGILDSPDFGFMRPFDVNFCKMLVRTASHLLGGDACGRFAFAELTEISLLLDFRSVPARWNDATELQCYLVGLASTKMSLQVEDEALFSCSLYAFNKTDLVIAYFLWRRQEAVLTALNRYCNYVLLKDNSSLENVTNLLVGLGVEEKEEVLRQHNIEYSSLPTWQQQGTAVYLTAQDSRITVETSLPPESEYGSYIQKYLD